MFVMNGKCIDGVSIEVILVKLVNKENIWRQYFNGQISFNFENLIVFVNKEENYLKIVGKLFIFLVRFNGQYSLSFFEIERCIYLFFFGIKFILISMYFLKFNYFSFVVMYLDYYCNKNNWLLLEYYLYLIS